MIISASCRTDLPAFYGRWFLNRLAAGYCLMRNPYRREQIYRVRLARPDVDGFYFWTKNLAPFLGALDVVARRGDPFVVNYTINGYPSQLEPAVPPAEASIKAIRAVSERFGPGRVVWRYDTVVFSSLTPESFHRQNFARLAGALEGLTDEVIVSCAQLYAKTLRNLNLEARRGGWTWEDPPAERKRELLGELALVAREHGMKLSVCSQPELAGGLVAKARCVDAERLAALSDRPIQAPRRPSRQGCLCHATRDIGEYDTCPHGCVYCYAVTRRELAQARHRAHDPAGEFLFPTPPVPGERVIEPQRPEPDARRQLDLFD